MNPYLTNVGTSVNTVRASHNKLIY